jgi:hypothetical protein
MFLIAQCEHTFNAVKYYKKRIKYKSNNELMTDLKSKQKQKINHMSIILK